jgi:putative ABC transport system permease protein
MQTLLQDLRYGIRVLAKNPGFTSAALLCLALGIGATTGIFSVVNAVLLRPLPFMKPDRLIRVYSEFPTFPNGGLRRFPVSAPEFLDLRREMQSWGSLDTWQNSGVNLAGKGEPTRATASFVTGGMLSTLGVAPGFGPLITPADDDPGAPRVADISYGLWQRAFGADRGIVGREILLNGSKCTVIGVMPTGFRFPPGEVDPPDVWTPLQFNPADPGERASHSFWLLGRLKPEVTPAQAQAELTSLVKHLAATGSAGGHQFDPANHTLVGYGLQDEVVRGVRPALHTLSGAVCLVLLIACVNVASLLLARTEIRQREIAIRGAIGASLTRLTLQFVTEGVVLSLLGALLGLALAYGGLELMKATSEASIPRASEVSLDGLVFLFTAAVCVATGVVFGLTPIAHAARQNLHNALKSAAASTTGPSGTQRFRYA